MLSYKEKYPLFNKNRHLKMTDATTLSSLSGLTTGKIKGTFQVSNKDSPNCIFSAFNENETLSGTTVALNVAGLYPLSFRAITTYGTDLYFNIGELVLGTPDYFLDGKVHNYEVIIDGVNNRFIVDGTTYSGADLTFITGSQTTQEFLDTGLTELNIGVARVKHGNPDDIGTFYTYGNIQKTEVYNNIDTLLYACTVSGNDISASVTTIQINNDILNLDMKNNVIDKSDNPKIIIESGTSVFSDGKYGEPLSSYQTTADDQSLTFNNTKSLDKWTIAGWVKINNNGNIYQSNILSSNNDALTSKYKLGTGFRIVHQTSGLSSIVLCWTGNNLSNIRYGGYCNCIEIDRWYYCIARVDSINKEASLFVNGIDITPSLLSSPGFITDVSKAEPFPVGDCRIGNLQDVGELGSRANYGEIKLLNYIISNEDIKAEYRKL